MTSPAPSAIPADVSPIGARSTWRFNLLGILVCAIAVIAAYSNSTRGVFVSDDWHTITQNPAIRSLSNIPQFFTDASTFSILPDNVDYRPVLQATYALDYAWGRAAFGDGCDPRPWHWTSLFLHFIVAAALFFLGRRLLGTGRLTDFPSLPPADGDWIALIAAVVFAVHPITTGCGNYMSARSTLLVAALAIPALVLYLHVLARPQRRLLLVPALMLYLLALFTKVEAISLLPVLFVAEALLAPGPPGLAARFARREPWLRLAAFVAATLAYLIAWKTFSPLTRSTTRAAADMTPYSYFCTQLSAWWYYLGQVFVPTRLVHDEQDFPIARSLLDARAAIALAGWAIVIAAAWAARRRAPTATFLIAAFFLFLLPHSSIVPLSEMVNEHRPYLACAGLFILFFALAYAVAARLVRSPLPYVAAASVIFAIVLTILTRQRNEVWKDDLSLWHDTAFKTPNSPRAHSNYGIALMRRGRSADAEAEFRRSLALAPGSAQVNANLATVLEEQGDAAGAAAALDRAVALDPRNAAPFYRRGALRTRQDQLGGAIDDFAAAVARNPAPLRELAALAECLIQTGRTAEADRAIAAGRSLDAAAFERERAAFRAKNLAPR